MKIYGVNISHDTSLAVIEDGVVTQVYEEERSRREKYFDFSKEYRRRAMGWFSLNTNI